MGLEGETRAALEATLAMAQAAGHIGGDLGAHIEHSLRFLPLVGDSASPALDMGSGGGIPGLVLAAADTSRRWLLVDATRRRADDLQEAVARLGLQNVEVAHGRAEDLARRPHLRGAFGCVVSRSFGRPAVTAECAAGFLEVGGRLVVSEPPEPDLGRWSQEGLAKLGLVPEPSRDGFQVCRQEEPCPERFPRRAGVPERKPLF